LPHQKSKLILWKIYFMQMNPLFESNSYLKDRPLKLVNLFKLYFRNPTFIIRILMKNTLLYILFFIFQKYQKHKIIKFHLLFLEIDSLNLKNILPL
jgi:hypothetical protein